jgi:hypothetical protein
MPESLVTRFYMATVMYFPYRIDYLYSHTRPPLDRASPDESDEIVASPSFLSLLSR